MAVSNEWKTFKGGVRLSATGVPTLHPADGGAMIPINIGDYVRLSSTQQWLKYMVGHGGHTDFAAQGQQLEGLGGFTGFSWDDVEAFRQMVSISLDEPAAELPKPPTKAPDLLGQAAKHMADRAATYDKPGGERSMLQTVAAFNAITGRDLTEAEGWLLLAQLKFVRDNQRSAPHRDSVEDAIAYAALYGEARLQEGVAP